MSYLDTGIVTVDEYENRVGDCGADEILPQSQGWEAAAS